MTTSHPARGSARVSLGAAVLWALVAACSPGADEYRATIHRTSYGIPHVVAADWASLGFGEGYAHAEDHLCSVADQVVRVRSERSRFFGAGEDDVHLLSDLGLKALDVRGRAADDLRSFPDELQELLRGYAAGYNHYLRETGVERIPGWCRGEPWVGEIEAVDIAAYMRSLSMISAGFFARAIAAAQPPGEERADLPVEAPAMQGASNGWAIGSERSEAGRGMLLANPHYPWVGSSRFWEKHLTIPGELDVYGVSLLGLPAVAIGFNEHVAWTHTVSSGVRFTLYRVKLADGAPTSYLYDGEVRDMEARTVAVQVRREDGSPEEVQRTMYRTHHGPVFSMRGFEWTEEWAFAIRDANADNDETLPQWLAMSRADGMDALQDAHAHYAGMPWVNTIAASSEGRAWYVDVSSTPNLSDESIEAWRELTRTDELFGRAYDRGLVLLDGGDPRFEWVEDPAARDPGLVPYAALPKLERPDYVFNANDSYWLANSSQLLSGYGGLHALQEETPRSPRTRMNDLLLSDEGARGPSGEDGRFSLDELTRAAFLNRGLTSELLAPAVAERCRAAPVVELEGRSVRLDEACEVLAGPGGRLDLESKGAVLWREFITQFQPGDLKDAGVLFAEPFDAADPVRTPRGLAVHDGGDPVLGNLARAVLILERAGLPLDVPLGEVQHTTRNGKRIPIHGGQGYGEGVTNFTSYAPNRTTLEPDPAVAPLVEGSRYLRHDGYPVNRGTSFIMALEFTDDGPRARALLTYSQSGDPESPIFLDQPRLFSRKEWRSILYRWEDIQADPELRTYEVSAPRAGP